MLWEELLCRESCNLIPVVPVFCVCVFIPGHSGSDSQRSLRLVFPDVVQQRHSADSAQILGAVWLFRVPLMPCLVQGDLWCRRASGRGYLRFVMATTCP